MSEQYKKFADCYLVNFNATQAAIEAGYSEKTARQQGSRLLTNGDITEYLRKRTEQASNERIMSLIERKEKLTELGREEGNGDTKDALKAIDTLNRMDQVYLERVDVSGGLKILKLSEDEQNL